MKTISLPTNKIDFIRHYLQLLNGLMELTEMELKVLARLVHYGGVITPSIRRDIKTDLDLKSMGNVNNYIKALKDKNILIERESILQVSSTIMPDAEGLTFQLVWSPSEE